MRGMKARDEGDSKGRIAEREVERRKWAGKAGVTAGGRRWKQNGGTEIGRWEVGKGDVSDLGAKGERRANGHCEEIERGGTVAQRRGSGVVSHFLGRR
jgi:hypothetical protein